MPRGHHKHKKSKQHSHSIARTASSQADTLRTRVATIPQSTRIVSQEQAPYTLMATIPQRIGIAKIQAQIDRDLEVFHRICRFGWIVFLQMPWFDSLYGSMIESLSASAMSDQRIVNAASLNMRSSVACSEVIIGALTRYLKKYYISPRFQDIDPATYNMRDIDARMHLQQLNNLAKKISDFNWCIRIILSGAPIVLKQIVSPAWESPLNIIYFIVQLLYLEIFCMIPVALLKNRYENNLKRSDAQFHMRLGTAIGDMLKFATVKIHAMALHSNILERESEFFSFRYLDEVVFTQSPCYFLDVSYESSGAQSKLPTALLIQLMAHILQGLSVDLKILMANGRHIALAFSRVATNTSETRLRNAVDLFKAQFNDLCQQFTYYVSIKKQLQRSLGTDLAKTQVLCEWTSLGLKLHIQTESPALWAKLAGLSQPTPMSSSLSSEQDIPLMTSDFEQRVWQGLLNEALLDSFIRVFPIQFVEPQAPSIREDSRSAPVLIPVSHVNASSTQVSSISPAQVSLATGSTLFAVNSSSVTKASSENKTIPSSKKSQAQRLVYGAGARPSNRDVVLPSEWLRSKRPLFTAERAKDKTIYHLPRAQFNDNYAILSIPSSAPDYLMFERSLAQASCKRGNTGLSIGMLPSAKVEYYGLSNDDHKRFYEIHTPTDTRVVGVEIEVTPKGERLIDFCILVENAHRHRPTLSRS